MNLKTLNLPFSNSALRVGGGVLAMSVLVAPVMGQITEPGPTTVRERIIGQLVALTGTPEPAAGDMLGAFFDTDKVCGRFVFTGTTVSRNVSILIYGDLTTTSGVKEGPSRNQRVTFKFFDASSNQTLAVQVLSKPGGEVFNYTYQGTEVPPLPIELPGLDLTPSRDLDFRIGDSGGDGGGNGGGGTTNRYDIDGDGKVTSADAALILRQVSGGNVAAPSTRTAAATTTTAGTTAGTGTTAATTDTTAAASTAVVSMDVNRDQRIDVNDAIEVMRNKGK